MNVFYLHPVPKTCAEMHLDKHVVKMPIEYAQLLSTSHRVLDGVMYIGQTKTGRKATRYLLKDGREHVLYMASHMKHPDELWLQKSTQHYNWLYTMWVTLCDEYTHRYGKVHMTDTKLREALKNPPTNLTDNGWVDPPQCMPEHCKADTSIEAYHKYYIIEKKRFAKWTKRPIPKWFSQDLASLNTSTTGEQYAYV